MYKVQGEKKLDDIKKIWKKKKWYIGYIIVLVMIVIITVMVGKLYNNERKQRHEAEQKLEELQKAQVSTDAIREEIKEVSKYSAYEFNYTSILYYSEPNKVKSVKIPFTTTTYIATIDGTINIGIEGEYIDFSTEKNNDGNITKIIVELPHSEILDNYTDSDTLKEYEYDKGAFNTLEPSEINKLRADAEKKEAEKIKKSDILQKTDERIEHLLKSNFRAFLGEDVSVELEYINVPNENKEQESNRSEN